MKPEQEQRAYELFKAALSKSSTERKAFIAQACCADPSLRLEVEAMLSAHERLAVDATAEPETSGRSGSPPAADAEAVAAIPIPARIGPYRILHPLGQGGMGSVYLGMLEDARVPRRAAVKVLKPGVASPQMLERFMTERRLLAALNHANIARLFDAGETDGGQPYFALEYVEGQPIDDYCDRRKLRIAERLELFRAVCSAVHYAHQNLIVHRDIKPGNVMVTKEGVPKLLDFGIAKLVNPDLAFGGDVTAPETRVMTLAYASPEQVRGEPISTASDIYSLGVLLYELLTGHRPYQLLRCGRAEAERIVCELNPERPSTAVSRTEEVEPRETKPGEGSRTVTPESVTKLRGEPKVDRLQRRLRGDLDNIVLMAMRKEPQRRYRSAEELSEDIRRHLDGRPVAARRPTLGYVAGKFIGRHRAVVAVAALLALSLVLAGLLAYRAKAFAAEQAIAEARRIELEATLEREALEKRLAQTQRDEAEARGTMIALLFGDARSAILKISGATDAMATIAAKEVQAREAIAAASPGDPATAVGLADAVTELAKVLGGRRNPSLGDAEQADIQLRRARDLCEGVLRDHPDHDGASRMLAAIHAYHGDAVLERGDAEAARGAYVRALAIQEKRYRASPGDIDATRGYGIALMSLTEALQALGRSEEMRDTLELVVPLRELLVKQSVGSERHELLRRDLAIAYGRLGALLSDAGDLRKAEDLFRRSLDIRQSLHADGADLAREQRDLAMGHRQLGTVLRKMGDPSASGHLQRYIEIVGALARDDPADSRAQTDALRAFDDLFSLDPNGGDIERKLGNLQLYLPILLVLERTRPDDRAIKRRLLLCRGDIGEALSMMGAHRLASEAYEQALVVARRLAPDDTAPFEARLDLVRLLVAMCERIGPAEAASDSAGATGACDEALALIDDLSAHGDDATRTELAGLRRRLRAAP